MREEIKNIIFIATIGVLVIIIISLSFIIDSFDDERKASDCLKYADDLQKCKQLLKDID